jgi:hypothetical protein
MMLIASTQEAPRFAEQRSRWLVGEFVESYVRWREAAGAANDAYARWTGAGRPRREIAFAAYRAALDGEEFAARAHRKCAERIARA